MATFDDMDLERKVTVYDKGFDQTRRLLRRVHHPLGRHLAARGSPTPSRCAWSASTSSSACATGRTPRSDGESGLRVVRVLEGLQASLDESRRAGAARVGGLSPPPAQALAAERRRLVLGEDAAIGGRRADRRARRRRARHA